MNQLVNYLLKHLPPQCVLIIESRAIPAFEFASLVSHREIFALNSNRLRFRAQEIRDLAELQGIGLLTQEEAERLEESFDGWITGILLTTRLGDLQQLRVGGSERLAQALPPYAWIASTYSPTCLAYSKALFQMGQYTRAHDLCQQTMALLPADEVALRAEGYLRLGVCNNFTGNFAAGIAQLQHALQLLGRNTRVRQTALLHSLLAGAYDMIGNYALSEHHRTRAMRCWLDLNDEQGKTLNQIGLGVTLQRQGMFSEAETVLTQALTTSHDTLHYRHGEAYALVSLGDVYQDQEKYELALNVTEDGLELARQMGDEYLINYTACSLAMTYLLLGDSQTALLLIPAKDPEVEPAETMGYDDVICKLALGTILLYQQRYREAELCLTTVDASLNANGLKREQLQANIRIADCYLEQGNMSAAAHHLECAKTLAVRHNYEHLV